MADDIQKVRRENLRRLVNEYEGMNELARQLGLTKGAYISQLLRPGTSTPDGSPDRKISEKVARKWEKKLGLAPGWMDNKTGSAGSGAPLNSHLLAAVIKEVFGALKTAKVNLNEEKLADLIAVQYASAAVTGQVDSGAIRTIVALLKR